MPRRKLIEIDNETLHALEELAGDRMASLQELADEAFADLLKKHRRPVGLREALRHSAAQLPKAGRVVPLHRSRPRRSS